MTAKTPDETPDGGAQASDDTPRPLSTPARTIDPLSSWRRHATRIPWIAAVVAVLGLPVAWKAGAPGYYTEAALRVSPSWVANLEDEADVRLASTTQYQQFVQQQVSTIRSYDVALATLAALGERRSLWQRPDESERRAAERLMGALAVRAVPNTYLVTIGLAGDEADGLDEIVNALAREYVRGSVDEGLYGADQRVRHLAERRDDIRAQNDANVQRLTALAAELGVSTFDDANLNPLDSRLVATGQALDEWRRRRIAAEARVAALEEALQREAELELESAAADRVDGDPAVASATKLYWDRRDALLAQAQGLSPTHPGYAPIQKQLADLDAELRRVTEARRSAAIDLLGQKRDTQGDAELSRARMALDEARRVEERLAHEQAAEQARLVDYTTRYQAAMDLTAEIHRGRKRIEAMGNRIDAFQLESVAPGFVRLVAEARVPELPSEGGRRKLLALVLVAAIAIALAVPMVLDRLDPRVVLPGDVEKALGFAPTAWVVERTDARTSAIARDQVRRLAIRLAREHRGDPLRVALTAVRDRAGATTLALELGAELTRAGLATVVVEARPGSTDPRYAGAPFTLADALDERCAVEDVVVAGDPGRPDRIALGDAADAKLVSHRGRLATALARLGTRYAVVLLDAPPVNASAEGELLLQFADVALLVVPANAGTPREARAAALVLEKAARPVVGVVVHRVRAHQHRRALAGYLPADGEADRRDPEVAVQRWLWT